MLNKSKLFKTNFLISIVLVVGFALTAVFSYRANYQASLDGIEQVSSLTAGGIYYQLTARLTKPVNISLTMAHDSLLMDHLTRELGHLEDEEYIETTKNYLETYRGKYGFDSVFLVSVATGRYYNFNGVDRVLKEGDAENTWYFNLLDSDLDYSLEVDNDEVSGANDEITVFVNCKIFDAQGKTLGIVGVGIRVNYLKDLLRSYEEKYGVEASLINGNGIVEISTTYTGYEKRDWFSLYGQDNIRGKILGWKEDSTNLELWTSPNSQNGERSFIVTRYIPELSWNLIVERNTGLLIKEMQAQLYQTCFILIAVILVVMLVVTNVIRNFNRQITELMEERQETFKKATEQLYDNIYELNITKNCSVGKRTEEYFKSLGAKGLPYDQALGVIAEQIKEEYREGYLSTFSPENVSREYENGNNHLRYDFMITQDGETYHWMRIDAHIFYSAEDKSIHMFTYRKNIDEEKNRELQAQTDEMTGFYNKKTVERTISRLLLENPDKQYAFFIFDIDNFKQANDLFGHVFGDFCIRTFTSIIRRHFRETDVLGRIGGDEFLAFIPIPNEEWAREKAKTLSAALCTVCTKDAASWKMSASIGIAISEKGGIDFNTLYQNADSALYLIKKNGKNGFSFYAEQCDGNDSLIMKL